MKKKFIIFSIMGGIGDQIFQFSYALYIKKKLNCNIILDLTYYENKKNNKYIFRLKNLAIKNKCKIIESKNKINFKFFSYLRFIEKFKINKFIPKIYTNFFDLYFSNFIYDYFKDSKQKLYIKDNSYYFGYWHDFKYVKNFKKQINKILINPELNKKKIKKITKKLQKNTVAIHIRGGDYANSPIHDVLKSDYYEKAVKYFKKKLKSPKFHVFTNDRFLAKRIVSDIKIKNNTNFISKYNLSDIEEFSLFSSYDYVIIGNSTFSLMSSFLSFKRKLSIGPLCWNKNQQLDKKKTFPKLNFL
jgi:hypothetical protein